MIHQDCRQRRWAMLAILLVLAMGPFISLHGMARPAKICPSSWTPGGTPAAPWRGLDVADPREVSRSRIMAYAASLDFAAELGQSMRPLLPYYEEYPAASIVPVRGNTKLTIIDLLLGVTCGTGWIVGKIVPTGPYFHGIEADSDYVWLDFNFFGQPRVLIIPADSTQPLAVLGSKKWEFRWTSPFSLLEYDVVPGSVPFGTLLSKQRRLTTESKANATRVYISRLPEQVRECAIISKTACWINKDSGFSTMPISAAGGSSSDGWIQVTGTGCVCVGSKCH